jgi:hypothetical protein
MLSASGTWTKSNGSIDLLHALDDRAVRPLPTAQRD